MRNALLAAVLLTLVLYGCTGEPSQEVKSQIAGMENEIAGMEREHKAIKAQVANLKSELLNCKDELQILVQEKLQEQAEAAADVMLEETPATPEHPAATPETPDHPIKAPE